MKNFPFLRQKKEKEKQKKAKSSRSADKPKSSKKEKESSSKMASAPRAMTDCVRLRAPLLRCCLMTRRIPITACE